jgi:5'-nucleotidase
VALLALALALLAQAPVLSHGQALPVGPAIADDPELARAIAPLALKVHESFARVLVQAPLGLARAQAGADPLGGFIAERMRAAAAGEGPVRFAFTSGNSLGRDLLPGPVRLLDFYEVLPYDNELVVAEYTGAQLLAIVKEGLRATGGEPCAGIQVVLAGTALHPELTVTWADGSAIDPRQTYLGALTDYLLASGGSTPTLKAGAHPRHTGIMVRQAIIDQCSVLPQPILPAAGPYHIAPGMAAALESGTLRF